MHDRIDETTRQNRFYRLSSEMFGRIAPDGFLASINPAWEQTFQSSLQSLCSRPFFDFLHSEDRCEVIRAFSRLTQDGAPISFEGRFLCGEGEYRRLQGSVARYSDGDYVAACDITEYRNQEEAISDAYQKLTFYMVNSPLAFVEWDPALRVSYWSPETEQLFGWSAEAVLEKHPQEWTFLYEEDTREFLNVMADLVEDRGQRHSSFSRHYRQDGSVVHCEWYHSALRDTEGQIISIFSLVLDVTERRRAESDLLKIRQAVESASDAICISDSPGNIIYINEAFIELFGYSLDRITPGGIGPLISDPALRQEISLTLDSLGSWNGEAEIIHCDGALVPVAFRTNGIKDDQGNPIGCITVCTDLRERKQAEKDLVHQAQHDALTGLPNRSYFTQRLHRSLLHAKYQETTVACMFVDLDNFKVINDSLGHEAGDTLLKIIAERLQAGICPEDMVARLGGDEFVVLIEDLIDEAQAMEVAERLAHYLKQPLTLLGREIIVTSSIGIAMSQPEHEETSSLLRDADVAMYQAKAGGKAGFVVFDPSMNAEAMERLELEMDLRHAIERGELMVNYQPIVQLDSGKITEVEALLRWNHPQRGWISPVKFIPIAEQTDLILSIGEWVLRQACRSARAWKARFPSAPPLTMSVNLSTRQLHQDNIVESIRRILEEEGVATKSIKLEITESAMMLDSEAALAKLHALKALGIRLAIDDFGTGYSSMAYLSSFPLDTLKIDRAFIHRLGDTQEDDAIVRAILTMAKTMGLSVTAEGIETDGQSEELHALGCDRGQGFLFAKPLTAAAFEELLGQSALLRAA